MSKIIKIYFISIIAVLSLIFCMASFDYSHAAPADDTDGDGIPDIFDNCVLEDNPDQRDTNFFQDDNPGIEGIQHYGNICDPDLNNDGIVDTLDFDIWQLAFRSNPSSPNWNPDADLDGNSLVGLEDFVIIRIFSGLEPGPGVSRVAVPAVNEWGMLIFMIFAGILSVFHVRKKKTNG